MSRESRPAPISKGSFNNAGQPNLGGTSSHVGQPPIEQQRFTYDQSIPPSPCFIHSNLSNGRDPSYFDSIGSSSTNGQASSSNARQTNASISSSNKSALNRNRPEPRHRAAQGAVEPESESEEESGSDASTDKNGSSAGYSDSGSEDSEDESDRVRSLTRQLAETAVGVREMSKQLGEYQYFSTDEVKLT